ncbi:GGDEF domain-containing protein [Zhongshania borealis]|uniref:GGDEF domain-containing protein n=1 Tax=Zhongshania borealis TaxID=889488 RepID=A0ABP7X448_9GAMM
MQHIPNLIRSYLIEPWLPQVPGINEYRLYRHRFVVSILWGTLFYIATIILLAQFGFNIEIESLDVLRTFGLIAIVGIAAALIILRSTGRQILALNISLISLGLGLVYLIWYTAGIYSPFTPCTIIIPALATLCISGTAGIAWSVITFVLNSMLFAAANYGFTFPNVIAVETQTLAEFAGLFTAIAFIVFITVYYDLSNRKLRGLFEFEHNKFVHLAHHDSLTGLANRRHFIDKIEHAIFDASVNNGTFCVLYFDLNDFKNINDTLGHHSGDIILVEFATRLRAHSRSSDIIARLGGDEFCMLLVGLNDSDTIKKKIRAYSDALAVPLHLEETTYQISASIGYAVYPRHGTDYESLLKVADQKMYSVKRGKPGAMP